MKIFSRRKPVAVQPVEPAEPIIYNRAGRRMPPMTADQRAEFLALEAAREKAAQRVRAEYLRLFGN